MAAKYAQLSISNPAMTADLELCAHGFDGANHPADFNVLAERYAR